MAISFEEWKRKKQGVPSGTPEQGMETPADKVPATRPRLTYEEWQASKQQAPTVEPETVAAVEAAPQPTPEPTPAAPSAPELSPYVTGGSYGTQIEQIQQTAQQAGAAMSEEAKASTKEFLQEEGLPIVGGIAAGLALPATATAGFTGWLLTAGVAGAGSSAGEFVEQVFKKEGLMDAPPGERPETWGDVARATIVQGGEDAALTAGTDALVRLVPKALRAPFLLGARLKDDNKHMVKVLTEKGGPVLASDVAESLVINYSNSVATHSFTKAGRIMEETREAQERVLGEAAQEPLTALVKKAGFDATDEYMDATLQTLPDEIVAAQLTSVLKNGERAAKDVAGSLYDSMNDAAMSAGTKMVKQIETVPTGMVDVNGAPILRQKVYQEEMPIYTVDVAEARKVLEEEIEALAKDLKPEASADYTKYAKSQLRLFSLTDEISMSGAVRQIKTMSQDARALARSSEPGAAEKRMFLLKSVDRLQAAMDVTASQMADAGITVGGRSITEVKREADKLWKGLNEDFGNTYVQKMLDKADATEGAAGALAKSFMQNRESAEAIMTALEASEKAGIKTSQFGMLDDVSKTRAAIGAKVYENMMEKVLVSDDIKGAMLMLNRPDSRKALLRILGDENLSLLDTSVRSLVEAKQKGLNVGAFTQFARESAALMEGVPTTSDTFKRFVASLSMPRMLSKGLRSKDVVARLQDANLETNLNRKAFIFNQVITDVLPAMWEDYQTLSPEEQEKLDYKNRLAAM